MRHLSLCPRVAPSSFKLRESRFAQPFGSALIRPSSPKLFQGRSYATSGQEGRLTDAQRSVLQAQFEKVAAEQKKLEQHLPRLRFSDSPGKLATRQYVLASMAGQQEAVERDASTLLQSLESPEVAALVQNPLLGKEEAKNQISSLGESLKLSDVTVQFLGELSAQGKLRELPQILKKYEVILRDARGEVPVKITATSLEKAQLIASSEKLRAVLARFLKEGESLRMEPLADTSLIDGYRVEVAGFAADFSLQSQLAAERKKASSSTSEGLDFKLARLKEIKPLVTEEEAQKTVSLLKSVPLAAHMNIDRVYPPRKAE